MEHEGKIVTAVCHPSEPVDKLGLCAACYVRRCDALNSGADIDPEIIKAMKEHRRIQAKRYYLARRDKRMEEMRLKTREVRNRVRSRYVSDELAPSKRTKVSRHDAFCHPGSQAVFRGLCAGCAPLRWSGYPEIVDALRRHMEWQRAECRDSMRRLRRARRDNLPKETDG